MNVILLVVLSGCSKPAPVDGTDAAPTDDTDLPVDTDAPVDTDTDTDTAPTGDTAVTIPIDCTLPSLPRPFETIPDITDAEDFDFDAEGYAVSVQNRDLVGRRKNGETRLISPNFSRESSGTRVLATGDILVADYQAGSVILVDGTTGGKTNLVTNMSYPNGMEVDSQNRAYVADQTEGTIRMIDVYGDRDGVIATGLRLPNGVILSPDEQTLYVGSFGAGKVYAIDRISDLEFAEPRVLHRKEGPGGGGFDGINVDACGNVYITEYLSGRVYRLTPDGAQAREIAELPSGWIPNMRWGNDIGGWDNDILYVSDRDRGRLFALDIGLPGKRQVTMP